MVVGLFLPGQPQQSLAVFLTLGKDRDFFIDHTFGQLALLHPADDGQRGRGYIMGHGRVLPILFFNIIQHPVKQYNKNCTGGRGKAQVFFRFAKNAFTGNSFFTVIF